MISGLIIRRHSSGVRIQLDPQLGFDDNRSASMLLALESQSIDRTVQRYGKLSDAELKRDAHLSTPMRALLRKEKIST